MCGRVGGCNIDTEALCGVSGVAAELELIFVRHFVDTQSESGEMLTSTSTQPCRGGYLIGFARALLGQRARWPGHCDACASNDCGACSAAHALMEG